jgi:SAM-dependent methyltransferase
MLEIQRLPFWPAVRLPYRLGRAAVSLVIDRALGVSTTLMRNEVGISLDQPADFLHGPAGWTTLWRIFRHLDVGPDDVLYDVGCGNGRPLLVAWRFPFKRVIGIELSPRMHQEAEANLARYRLRGPARVELINGDALIQPIPDGTSIIFFYNSFDGDIFDRFIGYLLADLDRRPRRLRFVYLNPREHAKLEASGRFRLTRRFRGLRPTRNWSRMMTTHFYEVLPARVPLGEDQEGAID